jgi:hypothetical protein
MAKVPEDLMDELHRANARFAELRKRLEHVDKMDLNHRESLASELREAELEVEKVSDRISAVMKE